MPRSPLPFRRRGAGFTLIELMIAVAVVAILASVAMPSYAEYVRRAKVPVVLVQLTMFYTRMEQRFQDTRNYGSGNACAIAPDPTTNFSMSCRSSDDGRGFIATATGQGTLAGYTYTIDQDGRQRTLSHPKGVPTGDCWSLKGAVCDS